MKLFQISGKRLFSLHAKRSAFSARLFSAAGPSVEEKARRNYANNVSEYNTVFDSLIAKRRNYLLRDAYDDMMLDGVQPSRDTFHSLIVGMMKGNRLQDAFYFRDEMKALGLPPDVVLYNFLISTCGKSQNSDTAVQLLEEMKIARVKPNGQTFICLLNACAADGRVDHVYSIVRDMTAAGLGLNKYCYAGLITAYKNKKPITEETTSKIVEFVKQSRGWSSVEQSSENAENVMFGVSEEEMYNIPTANYIHRRAFLNRQLTVYHVAAEACAELRSVETLERVLELLSEANYSPDLYIYIQQMRCYLFCGEIDRGLKVFEDYINSGKPLQIELYTSLAEGAMTGYTPHGMQTAEETLVKMNARGYVLNQKNANDLLLIAAGEKTGGYTVANIIWDMMQTNRINPNLAAVEAYRRGLTDREIPADDPRLALVTRTLDNLRLRFGFGDGGRGAAAGGPRSFS